MEKEEQRLHEDCCHEHGGRVHAGRTGNNETPDSTAHNSTACKTHAQLPPKWTGKRAQQCGKNTVMPVRKRIPKRRKKETKTVFPHSGHTSNNGSNNNRNKHHTRQLKAAVSSLSPIFMAARHRTPRESIAPPHEQPRHTIGSIHTRRHAALNDPTVNRPRNVAEITHPQQSTQRNIMSRGPRRQQHVMSTVWPAHGTIDQQNREVGQALNQGLSTHTRLF
ncbi:hypothetical protein TCDM_09766 [Trypanosoma cruzi Dm28c]|uniref:Uncharacterized protein n=1 Tax=Trypanosoma cruzi Dm28c TaxID=1416333 RepID=V5B979_TRYCR|nr:hypothetical protein TCDM_09766 [Trypanosoma cruzi Dm28c]